MLAQLLTTGALAASSLLNVDAPPVEIHDRAESAAAVAASVRLEPLAGRLAIQEGSSDGAWLPSDGKSAPAWMSRHAFELTYDAASKRLMLSVSSAGRQTVVAEHGLVGSLAQAAPNLMRVEVANFDANASVRLEDLELVQDGQARALRPFGRGAMYSDLATIWEPGLADGFVLRGKVRVDGAIRPSGARVWIDFGLGIGRRVAVDVEGHGWVNSQPAGLTAPPGGKQAVGFFAREQAVRLLAVADPSLQKAFRGWADGSTTVAAPSIDLGTARSNVSVTARFDPAPASAGQSGDPPPSTDGNGGSYTFSNTSTITIPAGAPGSTTGAAGPYPSPITVPGPIGGAITDMDVKLDNVTHTHPDDLDVLVVSPSGKTVLIMSDACGDTDIVNFDWTFDDDANSQMPDTTTCTSFFYRPTNHGDGETFPAPAPSGGYGTQMSIFNNDNPNGSWFLYVFDDGSADVGAINNGWQIQFDTEPYQILVPGTGSSGVANPYPSVRIVTPGATVFGEILDVDVTLADMTHSHGDDLDILVVGPAGVASILMSDACGSQDFLNYFWAFNDEAPAPMSDSEIEGCNPFNVQPTDYGSGDTWPAPAPAGAHTASLANLDGTPGTGAWMLFINDDAGGDVGFLETDWYVTLTLDGIFRNNFEE